MDQQVVALSSGEAEFYAVCKAVAHILFLLHIAAEEGHSEITSQLVEAGARLSEVDEDGQTPLHVAVASGHVDVVELLTRSQPCAQIGLADRFKMTPIHLGCEEDNPEMLALLLS